MQTTNVSLSNKDKLSLLSNLSTMLSSGMPLLETVNALLEDSKGNQKKLLDTLKEDLTQGKHIYFTFAKFPSIFSKVTTNLIKASEETGTLDTTLKDIKANMKKDMEFSDKIKSAMTYPIFVVFVFIGVLLLILIVVVPKIATVFERLRVDLPLPTKMLIFMSNAIVHYTIPVIIGMICLAVVTYVLYKKQKKWFFGLLLKLPILSSLSKDIDLTVFARSLYLLLNAGIPISTALGLAEEVVFNKDIAYAIGHAKNMVIAGKKLSEGFKDTKPVFPTIVIRITEAGERSGSLDKSMQEISEFMDYQVSGKLKSVTSLLEPILLVVMGGMVGGMMLAIIAPIYSLIGKVGSGR